MVYEITVIMAQHEESLSDTTQEIDAAEVLFDRELASVSPADRAVPEVIDVETPSEDVYHPLVHASRSHLTENPSSLSLAIAENINPSSSGSDEFF